MRYECFCGLQFDHASTCEATQSAQYCYSISVCLSVAFSIYIALRYCVKKAQDIVEILLLPGSPISLVFSNIVTKF